MNDLMTKSFLSYVDLKKAAEADLEMGGVGAPTADPKMELFLEEAEKVKSEMTAIREALSRLQSSHEESKSIHKQEALKSLRAKMNSDVVVVLKKARAIKSRLEEMDRDTAENRRLSLKLGEPIDRTRTTVTNGLRIKLKELMNDFQGLRQRMASEYKDTIGRCYYTVTGEHADEEAVEKMISSGIGEGEMMSKAIQEHGRGEVMETVVEIQGRYDAAKEIEQSLTELHQLFLDMAVMVEAQGEQMDNIEHHVMNASHYVKDGTKELKTAKNHQKSSRKWLCFGMILILLIVLAILVPIATSFTKS
ncbi:hypothetical protein V2J09_001417 [Rumex salicifolius]